MTRTVSVWQDSSVEELKGCFLLTDWEVFFKDNDISTIAETLTGYIQFCIQSVLPQKDITIYPNNKDEISPEIKSLIRQKRSAFKSKNTVELK